MTDKETMLKMKKQIKLCECGCGDPAPIASKNNTRWGSVKGEPRRFIKGHHHRKPLGEGVYTKTNGRNDRVSRILAEKAIGKPLPEKVQIHHFNEDPRDNRNGNLVVCENQEYHLLLHRRKRAHEASGCAHWRRCIFCKKWDDPKNLYINKGKVYHRTCRNKYLRGQTRERSSAKVTTSGSIELDLFKEDKMKIIFSARDIHGRWYRAIIDGETWDFVGNEPMIKLYGLRDTTEMFETFCVAF